MRVLVADDEQDMARALEAMLKSDGYEVDTVYDGQAALDFGETGTYDCIVLDIMMPYRDGLDVVRTLRSESVRTPILILTAKSAQEDVVGGLNSGADDYLTKPFSMVELLGTSAHDDARFGLAHLARGDSLQPVRPARTRRRSFEGVNGAGEGAARSSLRSPAVSTPGT